MCILTPIRSTPPSVPPDSTAACTDINLNNFCHLWDEQLQWGKCFNYSPRNETTAGFPRVCHYHLTKRYSEDTYKSCSLHVLSVSCTDSWLVTSKWSLVLHGLSFALTASERPWKSLHCMTLNFSQVNREIYGVSIISAFALKSRPVFSYYRAKYVCTVNSITHALCARMLYLYLLDIRP